MRTLVTAITFFALLVAPAVAQAGPLCRVLGLVRPAAKAPLKLVKARPARRALGRLLGR